MNKNRPFLAKFRIMLSLRSRAFDRSVVMTLYRRLPDNRRFLAEHGAVLRQLASTTRSSLLTGLIIKMREKGRD